MVGKGEYIPPEKVPTFGAAAAEWLSSKADHHPASVEGWRTHLRHLSPLNGLKLDRIEVAAIERLRDDLRKSLSAETVNNLMTTATAVFKFAQRRGYVTPTRPH